MKNDDQKAFHPDMRLDNEQRRKAIDIATSANGLNLKLKDIAELCGVSPSNLTHIVNRNTKYSDYSDAVDLWIHNNVYAAGLDTQAQQRDIVEMIGEIMVTCGKRIQDQGMSIRNRRTILEGAIRQIDDLKKMVDD